MQPQPGVEASFHRSGWVSLYLSPVPIDLTSDHSFGLREHSPSLLGSCNQASDKVRTVVAEAANQ